ncbi:MAG: cupin domain-containing protein [Planctomycetota bacterium]
MTTERSVHIAGPEDGKLVDIVGDRYRFLATAADTEGRYSLIDATVPPGGGPPPHRHSFEEEGFYILSGEITFYAGSEVVRAQAGTFVNAPRLGVHRFRNETQASARMLIFLAPGGLEGLFEKVGVVADAAEPVAPVDPSQKSKLVEAAPEFGVEIVLDES